MTFESALSVGNDRAALLESLTSTLRPFPKRREVGMAFVSAPEGEEPGELFADLAHAASCESFIACTAEGVIGDGREVQRSPAVSLIRGDLGGGAAKPFAIDGAGWERLLQDGRALPDAIGIDDAPKAFIVLADPFSTPVEHMLHLFERAFPGVPVVGGVASGGTEPGANVLASGARLQRSGAVGLAIAGEVDVEVIVSQGCRPIGPLMRVTGAEQNVIASLDGRPPLQALKGVFESLDADTREMARSGLLLGMAVEESGDDPGPGEFLVRNIMGADPGSGALAITDHPQPGQRVRFHVRDARTATDDLELLLSPQAFSRPPDAALLFSCNGRGTRLYNRPDGDITVVRRALGEDCPVGGFFCGGELGPIGARNHIHGQTASLLLLRTPR